MCEALKRVTVITAYTTAYYTVGAVGVTRHQVSLFMQYRAYQSKF